MEAEDPTCPAAASGLSNPLSEDRAASFQFERITANAVALLTLNICCTLREAELRIRVVSNWGDMRLG